MLKGPPFRRRSSREPGAKSALQTQAAKLCPCVLENVFPLPPQPRRPLQSQLRFLSPHLLIFDEREFKPHADSQDLGVEALLSTGSPVKAPACGDGRS